MNEYNPQSAKGREEKSPGMLELLRKIRGQASLLVHKEIDLAKVEFRESLKNEALMAGGLIAAALLAMFALNLLLMAAVFALALIMPAWAAALVLAGAFLVAGVIVGLVFWSRRVKSPMVRTRETIKDDLTITRRKAA